MRGERNRTAPVLQRIISQGLIQISYMVAEEEQTREGDKGHYAFNCKYAKAHKINILDRGIWNKTKTAVSLVHICKMVEENEHNGSIIRFSVAHMQKFILKRTEQKPHPEPNLDGHTKQCEPHGNHLPTWNQSKTQH